MVHKFFPLEQKNDEGNAMEVVAMEVGDTLERDLPESLVHCPPWLEVHDVMYTIQRELCVIREVVLPVTAAWSGAGESNLQNKRDEEGDERMELDTIPGEAKDVASSEPVIGSVKVSWMNPVGRRGNDQDFQEYKASAKVNAEISWGSLLCLKNVGMKVTTLSGKLPVRFEVTS